MHIVHFFDEEKDRPGPVHGAWNDTAGHKNPPSAPPAIPPIIITPFNRQIPNPAIDPRSTPPGPPIVPPRRPDLRM
jgi:hypothetical protein